MRRASSGFSVLELMAVISIMAILAALAIPGFGYLTASTRVKGASTELYLALIRARSESVKRNRGVAIVATSGDPANWGAGWQVIVDTNDDGVFNDQVIATQGALSRVVITMATNTVVFRPTGRISGATQPAFTVKSADPAHAGMVRTISADLTGRPYVQAP